MQLLHVTDANEADDIVKVSIERQLFVFSSPNKYRKTGRATIEHCFLKSVQRSRINNRN